MADGCNLYFTEKDLKDVESSIENNEVLNKGKFAESALDCLLKKDADKFISILWDKDDPKHRLITYLTLTGMGLKDVDSLIEKSKGISRGAFAGNALDSLLKDNPDKFINILSDKSNPKHKLIADFTLKSMGKGQVTYSEEAKIPSALKLVLQFTKYPQGLFSKQPIYRGPGSDRMKHPYELLTAAKLVGDKKIYTTTGKTLHLYNTDRIDFGYKHEGGFKALTKGGTFESDVLITREGGHQVGIDSKYRSDGVCSLTVETIEQIERIKNGKSDGQIESYYFVTNGVFSTSFHNAVKDVPRIGLCEKVNF